MRKLKLVLTGTGRCATGFYARFLTSAGIVCGHERFFSVGGLEAALETLGKHWTGTIAESSWLAAPFLDSEPLEDALVIHLVRHPKLVIESWLRVPPETTPVYAEFAIAHLPELNHYSGIDRLAYRYVAWNKLIECQVDALRFDVSREPIELLDKLAELGLESNRERLFDDRTHNAKHGPSIQVHLCDVKNARLREALAGYGWQDAPIIVKPPPSVKAIITTLDNLPNLKESVSVLRYEPLCEIIVVNNGSIDGTTEWLARQKDLTVTNIENNGAGPGRNAGLNLAGRCDYFLMLDGGIRPLKNGTQRMLDYLERTPDADVIGVEIPDFETDERKAWRRWPDPILRTYRNTRLSHTAYCLARYKAFDGLRFCEDGPFGQPGWGADDDEMMYQWNEAGIAVHVATGVHPYRHASGSFQRLFRETGIWATDYGSTYEQRVVWLQQNWPQYEPGLQWGEPWLTACIIANGIEKTARLIRATHDRLRKRSFRPPYAHIPNPYSVVVWGDDPDWLEWAEPRRLRQHHGNKIIIDGEIINRDKNNENAWTGDFRLCANGDWRESIRPNAYYYGIVDSQEQLEILLDHYDAVHPPKIKKDPPLVRRERIIIA
ncbi:MAG: glycosyltransferase family 2 protein [Planctomycetota bacterium]|jgi:glycosyltransferase involved in cell wall biosynthesis